MGSKTTRLDETDHLRTDEDRRRYLTRCFEEAANDAAYIAYAIGLVANVRNIGQLSADKGPAGENLSRALLAFGDPTFATGMKVVRALGYTITITAPKSSRKRAKP